MNPVPVKFSATTHSPNVDDVPGLPNLKSVDDVSLQAVGTPPSALTVAAPPSLPVYIRRNTLLTLQANLDHVTFTSRLISPFSRLAYGNFVSRYQEIVGTEPFNLLVSSNSPTWFPRFFSRTTSKSFTNISLDGSSDWAILKRDALQVYAGPSLEVSVRSLPSKISRRFSKQLKLTSREPTGLFRWFQSGYTFVHGRGALGLVGNGVVYSASISEGEVIAVNRAHLLGISVNGPHDLENCVVSFKNPVKIENIKIVPPPQVAKIQTWRDFWTQSKYYYWKAFDTFRNVRGRSLQHAIGNQDFVKVVGPRTILLQSGAPQESFERKFNLPRLAPVNHVETSPVKPTEKVPADYLNIVTIDPKKGASIKSTNDFKDALRVKKAE
ncbi:hypothetical protein JCM33374_g4300 [Metschnikowia sp. JCM 33374]|nr:hypothetical protein JCM33374_g4300 [Metschnikowia sp. JCM 33374]